MTVCPKCQHQPSGRIGFNGRMCHCRCHDQADAGPALLEACERALLELVDLECASIVRTAIAKAHRYHSPECCAANDVKPWTQPRKCATNCPVGD